MRVVLSTICLLFLSAVALAQNDRGTITGTVTDPTSALVRGATVTAKNISTGAEHKTVTTETGNYTLSSLPVGTYELTVEAPGFKKFISQGIKFNCSKPHASMPRWKLACLRTPSRSPPNRNCSKPRAPNKARTSAASFSTRCR